MKKHERIMAIDPGEDTGISFFEHSNLVSANLIRVTFGGDDQTFEQIHSLILHYKPTKGILEMPRIYPYQKAEPNRILSLAVKTGMALAAMRHGKVNVDLVNPHDWKGTVPKKIHNQRVLNALTEKEKELLEKIQPASKRHNVIDAIGLGLWYLKRMR
jgi:hypothetical protein